MIHLKSLESPEPPSAPGTLKDVPPQENTTSTPQPQPTPPPSLVLISEVSKDVSASAEVQEGYVWSENFVTALEKFLSPAVMEKLKQMYEQGPEPPFVSDSGWSGRQAKQEESEVAEEPPIEMTSKGGRGGRGGRGKARGGSAGKRGDNRRVITEVRTLSLHIHVAKWDT